MSVTKVITSPWGSTEPITVPEQCQIELYWQMMPAETRLTSRPSFSLGSILLLKTPTVLFKSAPISLSRYAGFRVRRFRKKSRWSPNLRNAQQAFWANRLRLPALKDPATCTSFNRDSEFRPCCGERRERIHMHRMNIWRLTRPCRLRRHCCSLFVNGVGRRVPSERPFPGFSRPFCMILALCFLLVFCTATDCATFVALVCSRLHRASCAAICRTHWKRLGVLDYSWRLELQPGIETGDVAVESLKQQLFKRFHLVLDGSSNASKVLSLAVRAGVVAGRRRE